MARSPGRRLSLAILLSLVSSGLLILQVQTSARAATTAGLPVVRIGVVLDGPEQEKTLFPVFAEEIRTLLEGEYVARFPTSQRIVANYTTTGVRNAVDRLLADRRVDMILALGVLASNEVG